MRFHYIFIPPRTSHYVYNYGNNLFQPGLEVIKLEFILKLKIKRNDWLLADMCPQATNQCSLFCLGNNVVQTK